MHDLHPEWIPILKTHCTPQRANALWLPCCSAFCVSRSLHGGAPARISVESGLKYLKKEFCEPAYYKQGQEGSWRGHALEERPRCCATSEC